MTKLREFKVDDKVTLPTWDPEEYFQIKFFDIRGAVYGLYHTLNGASYNNLEADNWVLWSPPKAKVTRWKYGVKECASNPSPWVESRYFYTEEEASRIYDSSVIKLDYTATEFEE